MQWLFRLLPDIHSPCALSVAVEVGRRNNYDSLEKFSKCTYGFVVQETECTFSAETLANLPKVEMVPMVVDWVIGNGSCDEAEKSLSTYACKSVNSSCYKPDTGYGYRCRCNDGYHGNPYLSNGCHGILILISRFSIFFFFIRFSIMNLCYRYK